MLDSLRPLPYGRAAAQTRRRCAGQDQRHGPHGAADGRRAGRHRDSTPHARPRCRHRDQKWRRRDVREPNHTLPLYICWRDVLGAGVYRETADLDLIYFFFFFLWLRRALIFAAGGGHTETATMLLDFHASIGAAASDGTTPLIYACQNGHTETAALLLGQSRCWPVVVPLLARKSPLRLPFIFYATVLSTKARSTVPKYPFAGQITYCYQCVSIIEMVLQDGFSPTDVWGIVLVIVMAQAVVLARRTATATASLRLHTQQRKGTRTRWLCWSSTKPTPRSVLCRDAYPLFAPRSD